MGIFTQNKQILIFLCINTMFGGILALNSTEKLEHFLLQRHRRSLIFQDSGTLRFVIGPAMPVPLGDPVTWRSLVLSYNLQGGHYPLPQTPTYPWDKWEDLYERSFKEIQADLKYTQTQSFEDDSRLFIYTALESYMGGQHQDKQLGRQCLLQSICENATVDQHSGIYAEILNIILTPGKTKMDTVYIDAYNAGKAGVDCFSLYSACPEGQNFLNKYLMEY